MTKLAGIKWGCRFVLFVFVFSIISSCGGGSSTNPQPVSVALENPPADGFAQQQIASAKVTDYTLTADTYQAMIDGTTPITVAKISTGSIAWIMPMLADGQHSIEINFSGNKGTVSFATQKVTVSQTAETLVSNLITNLNAASDAEITYLTGLTGQEAIIDLLQKMKTDLAVAQSGISLLTSEQKSEIAGYIQQNLQSPLPNYVAGGSIPQRYQKLSDDSVKMILAVKLIGLPGETAVGSIIGKIGITASYYEFLADIRSWQYQALTKEKLATADDTLSEPVASPKRIAKRVASTIGTLSFSSGTPRTFAITTVYTLADPLLLSKISEIKSAIPGLPDVIRSMLPPDVTAWASTGTSNISPPLASPMGTYSILSISDSNITVPIFYSIGDSGSLQLGFDFVNQSPPVPFSFTLIDNRDDHTTTISAALKFKIIDHINFRIAPASNPFSVSAGGKATLTATAYADGAQQIIVTDNPADFDWSISPQGNGNKIEADGRFTAGDTFGTVTVTVAYKNDPEIYDVVNIEVIP